MSFIKFNIVPGSVFGRWTITSQASRDAAGLQVFHCSCSCGNTKIVKRRHLVSGKSTSCGCYNRELSSTHGLRNHPLYKTYMHMIERCYHRSNRSFHNYGGRGIRVCERWLGNNGLKNFIIDVPEKPGLEYSIDRIDNDGNYEPSNVRWATKSVQSRNNRRNLNVTFNDQTLVAVDWDKKLRLPTGCVNRRLKHGWTVEEALTKPLREGNYYGSN